MQAVLVSSMDQLSQDEQDTCASDIASLISPGLSANARSLEGGEGSAKYIETQRTETKEIDNSSREIPAKDEPTEAEIVGPYEDIGPELQPIGGKVEDSLPHVPAGGRVGLNEKIKEFEYLLFHVDPIVIPPKTQTTILLPAPRKLLHAGLPGTCAS